MSTCVVLMREGEKDVFVSLLPASWSATAAPAIPRSFLGCAPVLIGPCSGAALSAAERHVAADEDTKAVREAVVAEGRFGKAFGQEPPAAMRAGSQGSSGAVCFM